MHADSLQIAPAGPASAESAVRLAASDRVAYGLTVLLVVFMPWNGFRFGSGAISDLLLVLAALALIPVVVGGRRPIPLPPWMAVAAGGLVVAALVTLAFPPSLNLARTSVLFQIQQTPVPTIVPYRSDLSALIKFEIAWLVLPLILVLTATTRRRCIQLLDLWAAANIVSAAVAILDYAGIAHLATRAIANNRSAGLTIHPNYLAFEAALAIPLALLWCGRSRRWTMGGLAGTAVLLGGVYVSGSRAATVGALLAIALTVLAVPRLRRGAGLAVPLAGMMVVALLTFTNAGRQIIDQVRLNSGNSTALASNTSRSIGTQIAFTQIGARPLEGVGFAVIEDAHNIYLQLLAAGGVIALVSFAVYCGGLARAALRALRGPLRAETAAAVVSILVWLAAGLFNNQLIDKFVWVVPGLLLAIARLPEAREPDPATVTAISEPALPVLVAARTDRSSRSGPSRLALRP